MERTFRLAIQFGTTNRLVPMDYLHQQCGYFYRLLGRTEHHDSKTSLYSYSMLRGQSMPYKGGLFFPEPYMLVSSYDETVLNRIEQTLADDKQANFGMTVKSVTRVETPRFTERHVFLASSGILLRGKQAEDSNYRKQYLANDDRAITSELLTQSLRYKMEAAGLSGDMRVSFAENVRDWRQKSYRIRTIHNKVSHHPVVVEGSRDIIQLAWAAGVGHCTGAGFGSLL